MKKLLIVPVLALLLAFSTSAQNGVPSFGDPSMDKLLAAREQLIKRYVLASKIAWGVAVCGEEDLLNGDERSFVTIYVYSDSMDSFLKDFKLFATPQPDGTLGVGGVNVSIQLIEKSSQKPAEKKPATPVPAPEPDPNLHHA